MVSASKPLKRRMLPEGAAKHMEELVTVAHFPEPIEAEMAKGRLESAGIAVFLSGVNAAIMEPGLGPLLLQVQSKDAEDARTLLNDAGEELAEAEKPGAFISRPTDLP